MFRRKSPGDLAVAGKRLATRSRLLQQAQIARRPGRRRVLRPGEQDALGKAQGRALVVQSAEKMQRSAGIRPRPQLLREGAVTVMLTCPYGGNRGEVII